MTETATAWCEVSGDFMDDLQEQARTYALQSLKKTLVDMGADVNTFRLVVDAQPVDRERERLLLPKTWAQRWLPWIFKAPKLEVEIERVYWFKATAQEKSTE